MFVPATLLPTTPPCWVCSCVESSQRRRCPPCSGTGSSPGGCCRHRRSRCDLRRYCSEHKELSHFPHRIFSFFSKRSTKIRVNHEPGVQHKWVMKNAWIVKNWQRLSWLPIKSSESVSLNISQMAPTIWLVLYQPAFAIKLNINTSITLWLFHFRSTLAVPWGGIMF